MPVDPYAPPKSVLIPQSRIRTLFERASVYQSRAIYLGLALMIGSLLLAGILSGGSNSLTPIALTLSSIGGIVFVIGVFLTLPLSIWGIIDGYKEGRKNRRIANKNTKSHLNDS